MNSKKENKKTTIPTYNSDITDDDIQAIGKKGLRADSEDDRMLLEREEKVDFKGENLDVPARDKKNTSTSKTMTDEENSLFGQGGESKANLEAPERANTDKS